MSSPDRARRPLRVGANPRAAQAPDKASAGGERPTPQDQSSSNDTIDAIDRQVRDGFPLLKFGPALEQRYVSDTFDSHRRHLVRVAAIAMVLYDLFLLNDRMLLSDVFSQAVIGRLAVFTPLALITIYVSAKTTSPRILESACCAMSVVSLILTLSLAVQSESPYRSVCVYGALLVMMFCSVVHRLRFGYAAAAIAGMLASVFFAMPRMGMFGNDMLASNVTLFATAATLLVTASYGLEHKERQGYLVSLRGRLLNRQLELSSSVDPLTSLWNRRVLTAVMDDAWAAAAPTAVAIIIADIDHFKLFNDSYGHLAGDLCLQQVADGLRMALPGEPDVLVRFGGEEFVVFAPGRDGRSATGLAERLQAAVRSLAIPHPVLGPGAAVTASFGIAAATTPAVTPAALIELADRALYEAKRAGRDCLRVARPDDSAPGSFTQKPGRGPEDGFGPGLSLQAGAAA